MTPTKTQQIYDEEYSSASEERAKEYASKRSECTERTIIEAYEQGASDERELLTRWHDPKTEDPYIGSTVLVRYSPAGNTSIVMYETTRYQVQPFIGPRYEIEAGDQFRTGWLILTGWRYIHE